MIPAYVDIDLASGFSGFVNMWVSGVDGVTGGVTSPSVTQFVSHIVGYLERQQKLFCGVIWERVIEFPKYYKDTERD